MENKLIARVSVLYLSRLYKVGDELPTSDPVMVQAWLEAGSAVWESGEAPAKKPTAKPVTAEPGLPGDAGGAIHVVVVGDDAGLGRGVVHQRHGVLNVFDGGGGLI